MSAFSVDGLVSGLDTAGLIRQLMQVEAVPQQRLRTQLGTQTTAITAYQSVASSLKKLDDAAAALAKPQAWGGAKAAVSGDAVTATARPGAATGSFAVEVTSLAAAASWTTDASYGMDEAVFSTDAIHVVKADGSTVDITPSEGTMRAVMSAINAAADTGVRAVALRTGPNSYRLQVVSTETGTEAAPQSLSGLGVPVTAKAATDAAYEINGIAGTSGSNTVTDMVSGVDITLARAGASATVSVTADPNSTVTGVQNLVKAANDALADIRARTKNDPSASSRGPLASDFQIRSLTGRIAQAFSDALGGASPASIGIQTTRDGTLSLDTEKLTAALAADPAQVRLLVSPTDGGTGLAQRLRSVVTSATDAGTGFITSAVQGRESTKRDLQTQIDSWDRRLEIRQTNLQRQFSALEVALGRMQSQSTYLAGQLAGLQSSSGELT